MAVATHPQIDVHDNSLAGARAWFAEKGLSRPREGRVLAGVCAGFARRYEVNPLVARLPDRHTGTAVAKFHDVRDILHRS
jgi:PspC domain-containing protein